jgi:hypothetical protein
MGEPCRVVEESGSQLNAPRLIACDHLESRENEERREERQEILLSRSIELLLFAPSSKRLG